MSGEQQDPVRQKDGDAPPEKRGFWPDVLGFATAVFAVWWLGWQVKDVIWSLWASSLCVGYAYILTMIVMPVIQARGIERIAAVLIALFMLAFFTFHFVHGVFLNGFFPLGGSGSQSNPLPIFKTALATYWPFVLSSFIARWPDFKWRPKLARKKEIPFAKPYVNVVRMHLLIFVFAGLKGAGLDGLAIYPVLAFYFVPWGAVWARFRQS
ncbi:MAG TPA: DUF6498-containing protein [Luteolibacter sp.]|nr:DUF6498-containing protein [Luteolibacter sp.]